MTNSIDIGRTYGNSTSVTFEYNDSGLTDTDIIELAINELSSELERLNGERETERAKFEQSLNSNNHPNLENEYDDLNYIVNVSSVNDYTYTERETARERLNRLNTYFQHIGRFHIASILGNHIKNFVSEYTDVDYQIIRYYDHDKIELNSDIGINPETVLSLIYNTIRNEYFEILHYATN